MYSYNMGAIGGQSTAYVFFSLFNPANSGIEVVLHQIQVTPYASATALSNTTLILQRITSSTDGTLTYDPENPSSSAVNKLQTSYDFPNVEIRTGDPTISGGGAVIGRFAPPIQPSVLTSYIPAIQEMSFLSDEWGRFVLAEGEGVALRQTAGGSTSHRWPTLLVWAEQAVLDDES